MSRPVRRSTLLALAACAAAYLYASPYYPSINNPNENVRVQMTAALVDEGDYRIDAIRARWGFTNDAACVDLAPDGSRAPCEGGLAPGHERRLYSVKAPLGSFLAVPAYALARAIHGPAITQAQAVRACRLGGSLLPILALLFFVRRYFEEDLPAEGLARETAFFALVLGSVLFGYALIFASHTQSAVFAFVAFARLSLAARRGRIGWLDAASAGFLASGVTALEYPCLFVTATLCVYALVAVRPFPRVLAFGLGALVPVLLVMHFQAIAFGSPFRPGHLFVENAGFRAYHQQGFFGADKLHLDAATRLLVDPKLGLFATTPFFLLAPLGFFRLLDDPRRRRDAIVALALVLVLYVPVVFLSNWDGGWVIGPRYLVAILPFLAWLSAHGAALLMRHGARFAAIPLGLLLASMIASGLPSTYYPHLPPEIRAPIVDLFGPLVRDGFAPQNLGLALGLSMKTSMLPLALLGLAVLLGCALTLDPGQGLRALGLALPIAFVALAPQLAVPAEPSPPVEQALRFIEEHWDPPRPAP